MLFSVFFASFSLGALFFSSLPWPLRTPPVVCMAMHVSNTRREIVRMLVRECYSANSPVPVPNNQLHHIFGFYSVNLLLRPSPTRLLTGSVQVANHQAPQANVLPLNYVDTRTAGSLCKKAIELQVAHKAKPALLKGPDGR